MTCVVDCVLHVKINSLEESQLSQSDATHPVNEFLIVEEFLQNEVRMCFLL